MTETTSREYSQLLGAISDVQLQAALDRFGLGTLVEAAPAPGGLFGQNVLVTSSAGEWVLRGAPHYDGQFEKEACFSRLVHERTPSEAPWPFLIEKSSEVFGWSYAVMPRLRGLQLQDPGVRASLTPADRTGIARAMGEHLALLHQATWDAPAVFDYKSGDLVPMATSYAEYVIGETRAWLERSRAASPATTDADVAWVESIIDAARPALAEPFAPTIVHTDYAEGNVVAEREGDGWRVTGMFDLGDAHIGDGAYDLARLACAYGRMEPQMLPAFVEPFLATRPPAPGFAERMALYILLDRLIIWEYGQRNRIWFSDFTASAPLRRWAEGFTDIAGRLSP